MTHTWTEYPDGGAHCPVCGAVRRPDGYIDGSRGDALQCVPWTTVENESTRRVIDGVIVDGPPS